MRVRGTLVAVGAVLAVVASWVFVPVRTAVTRAPSGAWDASSGPEFASFSGNSLPGPAYRFFTSGGIIFLDRRRDIRVRPFWGREFERGAVRLNGRLVPAYRGPFVYKRAVVAFDVLVLCAAGTLLLWWRRQARRASPEGSLDASSPEAIWWRSWRRRMAGFTALLLVAAGLAWWLRRASFIVMILGTLALLPLWLGATAGMLVGWWRAGSEPYAARRRDTFRVIAVALGASSVLIIPLGPFWGLGLGCATAVASGLLACVVEWERRAPVGEVFE